MPVITQRFPDACQQLMRLTCETAQMGKDPRRNYNFALALARQQLYLGDYDDYKETKAQVNSIAKEKLGRREGNPELFDIMRITEQIAAYHAKRGEMEKLMQLVGEHIMPEAMALRALLENGCYSDFRYLKRRFNVPDSQVESIMLYHLVNLCVEGKLQGMQELKKAAIVPENLFDEISRFAKKAAERQIASESRIWAARVARDVGKYSGNEFVESVLKPLDNEFDRLKKDSRV